MRRCAALLTGCVLLFAVMLAPRTAHAQYRGHSFALVLPLLPEPFEMFPYTVAAFATSQGIWEVWKRIDGKPDFDERYRSQWGPCSTRKPYSFPCINNQFGLSDALWAGGAFTYNLGDLNIDWQENPIIKNLWIHGRGLLGVALTLAGRAKMFPVFVTHAEIGIKWNILDERIRPYVAMNSALNVFIDPAGLYGNIQTSGAACQRAASGEAIGATEKPCADADVVLTAPSVRGIVNMVGLYSNLIPISPSVQPEVGLEYFFKEDLSMQVFAQPILYLTWLPPWVLRPPFVANISTRVGVQVSSYF